LVITNLKENNKYFVRSYAINEKGIAYGNEQNFTTLDFKLPTITTNAPTDISYFSAMIEGVLNDNGGLQVFERGICYSLNPNPTTLDSLVIGDGGLGTYKVKLDYLKDNSRYYFRAFAKNSKGIGYGNQQSITTKDASKGLRDDYTKIVEVKSKTGRTWMDRNLGAMQAATSLKDEKAYGDLYQWGRGADGHQLRNSSVIKSTSNKDVPGHTNFISAKYWRIPPNYNLWQGGNGINNPCPTGFHVPTQEEWISEINTWISKDLNGAFASPLKLPIPGDRVDIPGWIINTGLHYVMWSSTFEEKNIHTIYFDGNYINTNLSQDGTGSGIPIRCIKD
jgi:uncharacterized protein (TIGR02145 family)